MAWVELRYATLEASGFDEPYKVYIRTMVVEIDVMFKEGGDHGAARLSRVTVRIYMMTY